MKKIEIRDDKKYWKNIEEYYKALEGKYMRLRVLQQVDNVYLNLENLKKNGLKAAPQGPKKLIEYSLLNYINSNFNDNK